MAPGRTTTRLSSALAALLVAAACNGPAVQLQPEAPQAAQRPAPASPPGHGGELLPGLAAIPPAADPGAAEALPTDRDGLLRAGRRALAESRLDEALSIAEVLLLVHGAGDPEVGELRGRCLAAQGDQAAAAEELAACCAAGRSSCCGGGSGR